MYCPHCGQQQAPGAVRFCSRCGFPLEGVMQLLNNGGMLAVYREPGSATEISPRKKGVRQGGMLFLLGVLLVPILGLFASYIDSRFPEILTALAAIICFIGGPLRMLFAAIFEEGAPQPTPQATRPYMSPQVTPRQFGSVPNTALPPPTVSPVPQWRQRPITAELATPPSVTENTTRLLDKEDRTGEQ